MVCWNRCTAAVVRYCYAVGYVAAVELRVVTENHSVTDAAFAMWLVCCRNLEKKFGSTTDKEQRV